MDELLGIWIAEAFIRAHGSFWCEWHKCLRFGDKSWITLLQVEEPVRKWTAEPVKKKSSTYQVNFDLESITIVDKVVTSYVYYFVIG